MMSVVVTLLWLVSHGNDKVLDIRAVMLRVIADAKSLFVGSRPGMVVARL